MAIYYYKKYYKESMKLTTLQSQIKEETQIKRIAIKKECSRLKKKVQQAQKNRSATALENEHKLAQKLQQRFNSRYDLINEILSF
jgi:hypothetical protein